MQHRKRKNTRRAARISRASAATYTCGIRQKRKPPRLGIGGQGMNELKPEDVMRALECCTFNPKCDECPLGGEDCINLDQLALALLREKDAEIERLNAENEEQDQAIIRALRSMGEIRRTARAEAISEFADRLKTFYKHLPGNTVGGAVEYHIDQIAKEMKEGRG
jgi:hypothetical protein